MKKTELFDYKASILLGDKENNEWEFVKEYIFNGMDYEDGIPSHILPSVLMEIFGYRGKVLGIETIDKNNVLHVLNWESYQKYYTNDWTLEAVKDIKSLGFGTRSYVYMTFPRKVINKYLEDGKEKS